MRVSSILVLASFLLASAIFASAARADTIQVTVVNETSDDHVCHVYDLFGHGRVEVGGSPFSLASNDARGATFVVNKGGDGNGLIEYQCEGGPILSQIQVTDGQIVEIR